MRVEILTTEGAKHTFERVKSVAETDGHTIEVQFADKWQPVRMPREYIVGIQIDV